MVVYRNGRPARRVARQSPNNNSRRNLTRLSALLIGGLGVGLIASPAAAQQVERRKRPDEAVVDRPDREARREARRQRRALNGRVVGKRYWDQYPGKTVAKSDALNATVTFSDKNPPLLHGDTFFWSKPAFANIDGDSDLDAFVGEYLYGAMVYYENTGSAGSPAFATGVVNAFGIDSVTFYAAPTFADLDGDGDLDLFVGNDNGDIYYSENTDDLGPPGFLPNVKNPFGLTAVPGYYATPAFVDIDGDGDLDLFSGNQFGEIIYYENVKEPSDTAPIFTAPLTDPFGFSSVSAYSTPTFVDIDGDGDFDAFVGDDSGDSHYFENMGDPSNPNFASNSGFPTPLVTPFGLANVIGYSAPTFADLDGDGDFDATVGAENGFLLYHENEDTSTGHTNPSFTPSFPFGMGLEDRFSSPTFADLDGDGDLDVLIGERLGDLLYFVNSGNPTNAAFPLNPLRNPFGLTDLGTGVAPTFVDLDGDNLIDVVVGEGQDVFFLKNTGSSNAPVFAEAVIGAFGLSTPGNSTLPAFVDIDGDGDLDFFTGKVTSSLTGIFFQENMQGSDSSSPPAFASFVNDPFGLTGMPDEVAPAFADVDGDGDFDLLAGGKYGNLFYFENTGSPIAPAFAAAVANPSGLRRFATASRPAFADIDADGTPDVFSGMRTGRMAYFENQTVFEPTTSLLLSLNVLIEGPYSASGDSLVTAINGVLPTTQPYGGSAFTGTPLAYSGTESVVSMPALVVDWVLVQLRTGSPPSPQTVVATKAALLMSNGSIVDADGSSPVSFSDQPPGDYYIVVFQRNHLGVMTESTLALTASNTTHDFTTASSQAFGTSPMAQLETGIWGLFAADANVDGQTTATDFNAWLVDTKAVVTGYAITDFNLDGGVTASDFNLWLVNTKAVVTSKVPSVQ